MKKLLVYMKGYIPECILGPLFKLGEASLELLVPLVVADIIDGGIAFSDRTYIVKKCLVLAGLAFAGLVLSVTAQYFAAKASTGFTSKIRSALFAHIQTLSYSDLDRLGTSTVITRMTGDTRQLQSGVNLGLRLLLRSPFVVFGAMIMAFTVDAKSALVFAGTIPVLAVIVFGIMLSGIPLYKKVQGKLDGVLGLTRENLSGVRVIRAFGREDSEKRDFTSKNNALVRIQEKAGRISALLNPATYVIINGAVIILIYAGALRVDGGNISKGDVVALYNYMSQILVELIKLANLIISITKAAACGKRISEVMEMKPSMDNGSEKNNGDTDVIIRFDDVSLRYNENSDCAVENVSLELMRGQTLGIIGGTGSGKTSIASLIPRFYDATSGAVYVDGINVKDYDITALRRKIGFVGQRSVLFKGTIRENLLWGNENATDDDITDAVVKAQASDIVSSKDGGLDFVTEQGGSNLSGGQKQRLTIARALVRKPEILILDDSSSALDFATDAALRKAVASLEDTTVIIVSQRTSSVMHADKIIVTDDGRVVGEGTHGELLENCSVYREIYDSQYAKAGDGA